MQIEYPNESSTDAKNQRRCELVDKKFEGTLTPAETSALANPQRPMIHYVDCVAALPLDARKLHRQLLEKWIQV